MMNSGGYSLADIAAATGSNNRGNNDGWGGDGWGWIWIILLFALFGWGGNGFGGFGGNGAQGALTRADLCQDMNFQNLESGVRGIQQGLCDGFYAMNTSLLQGFNGVQQGFNGVQSQLANMAMQNQQCCCETQRAVERGFCDTNYNLATQSCDTRNTFRIQPEIFWKTRMQTQEAFLTS